MTSLSQISSRIPAAAVLVASLLAHSGCETLPADKAAAEPAAATAPATLESVRTATYADNPNVFVPLDAAVAAAGTDPQKLTALTSDLLAMVQSTEVSAAVRQAAAQRLGTVLGAHATDPGAAFAVLAGLLQSEETVDAARLALDPVPGTAVDEIFLAALVGATGPNGGSANGRARLGVIQSLGQRRVVAAVPALAALLEGGDPAAAALSAWALGQIGGPEVQAVLARAKNPVAPAILNARLAAAARDDAADALRVLREIRNNAAAPHAQRAAALRGLIERDAAGAVAVIKEALTIGDPAFHPVVIQAIAHAPGPILTREVAAEVATLDALVQPAVIAALGRRGDAAAVPALRELLFSRDAAIRLAAIEALGRLPGDLDTALQLARLAAREGDDAKAAAAALARLDGPGLDDVVRAGAASGDPALRLVFLRQLALRNVTEAVPYLLSLRESDDGARRLAALEALGDLAAAEHVPALLDWATGAAERAEQTRAVRSLISVILRDDAVDTRAAPVLAAIDNGDASRKSLLLPVLSRAGGAPALACAARLSLDADAAVAGAAVAQLARWPDDSALDSLLAAAEKAGEEKVRSDALTGATRILEKAKPAERTGWPALLGRLLTLPVDQAAKDRLYYLLSLCEDPAALRLAEEQAALEGASAAALDAAAAVRANLMWPPFAVASVNDGEAMNAVDRKDNTWWQVPAQNGTWLRLDLKISRPVRVVTLEHNGRNSRFPVELEVCVSDDPQDPGAVRTTVKGTMTRTVITLPAGVRGRYLLLRHVGERAEPEWAVNEVKIE